jgi:hypothetical protein
MAAQITGIFSRPKCNRSLLVIFTKQPPAWDTLSSADALYMVADEPFGCIH